MKRTILPSVAASLTLLMPALAQVTETTTKTETTQSANGTVTESSSTTTTTFQPEIRTKAVQYFETYKANPHGLPPGLSERVVLRDVPAAWRTTRLAPGVILTEKERPFLIEAPPELVRVLPAPTPEVRYYLAGSNVVAVNKTYQVVDSIQIPTVKIVTEP